jgi:hypothetical protein
LHILTLVNARPATSYLTLKTVALNAARLDSVAMHGRGAALAFWSGFLTTALDTAEMGDLTVALYGLAPSGATNKGLQRWELDWYAASLPAAPCKVLVTAAGMGREVRELRRLGYSVDAFEPAPGQASRIEAAPDSIIAAASYEDLVRATLGDSSSAAAPFAARRYDAVILGWGSLTHVLERESQRAVLAACDALCPTGPILASFWPAAAAAHRGRAFKTGWRAGRAVARLRRRAGASAVPQEPADDLGFSFNVGFTRRFSREDLEALAAGVGRSVATYELEPYARATLVSAG